MEITLRGPERDLHSGQFGGAVINPIHALAQVIAGLHDADGRITIKGFYDAVRPLEASERAELDRVPFDVAAYERATGPAGGVGEAGYSVVERLGARPSLDANGIWGGWTGAGAKTVIPAEAHAKISMRLVPDQDPKVVAHLFDEHVRQAAPPGTRITVRELHGGYPVLVDRTDPAMQLAARAYADVFGVEPVFMREGGTIPVVSSLQRFLGIQSVLMGFGLPDDNLHAPNEKMDVLNYHLGVETAIAFQELLAESEAYEK
jgi:acetylornithine deacetylase/succinyl-diaminopimelate desuccinylase-like protein